MEDNRVRPESAEALSRQAVLRAIIVGDRPGGMSFELHPQHHDRIDLGQNGIQIVAYRDTPRAGRDLLKGCWNERGRPNEYNGASPRR